MSPRDKNAPLPADEQVDVEEAKLEPADPDRPDIEQPDWDGVADGEVPQTEKDAPARTERSERTKGLPDEEDDNFYQSSDEALPEDNEEAALDRNPSKEGGRFDEV